MRFDMTYSNKAKRKVLVVVGTRPEAIKLAPVIKELSQRASVFDLRICVTAQHREMLDQMLELFEIKPDIDLDIMRPKQALPDLTARVLRGMSRVFKREKPDLVLIQGDTTTVLATALAAFYQRIPVGHVEAGLRTRDRYNPFPEEINRRLVGSLAHFHFAPTPYARENLLAEGVDPKTIFVTGNTVIDALKWILSEPPTDKERQLLVSLEVKGKLVVVTAHRRESFGQPLVSLCRALRTLVERNPDVTLVYPVHPNPQVREVVRHLLTGHKRIYLIEPLPYASFVRLMHMSYMIMTDSGGIQEEATALGKPVLVLREKTERPEVVEAGVARLVGTDEERIVSTAEELLNNRSLYRKMARAREIFGDGHAAERIADILEQSLPKETKYL